MGKEQNNIPEFLLQMIDSEIPIEKHFVDSDFIGENNEQNVNTLYPSKEYAQNISIPQNNVSSIESQLTTAEEFVSKRYLSKLENADVIDFNEEYYPQLAGMTWFKITKMVYERGVFFPDQMSTLYAAMHGEARQMVFVVQKEHGEINFFVGTRDNDNEGYFHSGELLKKGFHGVFPGVCLENSSPLSNRSSECAISSVSGVASLRSEDNGSFIQGLERVINATSEIPKFTAIIIADNIDSNETSNIISGYKSLYSDLLPLAKLQRTYSVALNQSESETTTTGFSKSLSKSISRTIANGTSKSKTIAQGTFHADGKSSGYSVGLAYVVNCGYNNGKNKTDGYNDSTSNTNGTNYQESDGKTEGTAESVDEHKAKQLGNSKTESDSVQISVENKHISCMVDVLDVQIRRLEESEPYGLWNCCTYFIADTTTTANNLANIYKGLLVGDNSGVQTMAVNRWLAGSLSVSKMLPYLERSLNPLFLYEGFKVTAGSIVSSKELAIHMSLPQTSVSGVLVREQASFGRNVQRKDGKIQGNDSFVLGKVYHLDKEDSLSVSLDIKDLAKHTFVTGSTGSGKSNTIYTILNSLPNDLNYLVVEPAKGEYIHYLKSSKRINLFTSERHNGTLLKINPFKFPNNIDIYQHIGKLVEIFNVCWPMYAAMPAVLKDSIIRAYESCGWNLSKSINPWGLYPTFKDVVKELKNVAKFSDYSADTKADYVGSLETRLKSLTNGINGEILVDSLDIEDELLFDSRTIIDLSCLDIDSRSLVMGLLTLKLYEHRRSQSKSGIPNRPLHHVTVLEEAHNILPRTSKQQSAESSNLVGKSVEMISNAIAEMRTYGEGFIIVDQSPTSVDEASIKNTNTKIIMSLPDGDDRYIVGKSVGLNDFQIEEISMLPTGVGIVFQNNWSSAVLCKMPYQEEHSQIIDISSGSSSKNDNLYFNLIDLYKSTSYNENLKEQLVSLFVGSCISSSLKYDIFTKHISNLNNFKNICSLIILDLIGVNVAKEIKYINDKCKYTSTLKILIKRKIGIFDIKDEDLFVLADMYVKGICYKDNDLKTYQLWKEANYGD
jgi:energy-coupling factor transporter ATP-binding protein EcfA2